MRRAMALPAARDRAAQVPYLVRRAVGRLSESLEWDPGRDPPREAAVLLPLYPGPEGLTLALVLRADGPDVHAGQVGLPGGGREPGDASLRETAVREAEEELGLDRARLEVIGELGPVYVPVSGYQVAPFVALVDGAVAFRPDPREVQEVLELPLSTLRDPAQRGEEDWPWGGEIWRVRFFRAGAHRVWGATARVLAMLVAALEAAEDEVGHVAD